MTKLDMLLHGHYDSITSYYDDIFPGFKKERTMLFQDFGRLIDYLNPFQTKWILARKAEGKDLSKYKKALEFTKERVTKLQRVRFRYGKDTKHLVDRFFI